LILDYAKNVQNNGLVNKQQLSHDIFGGIPLPIEPLSQSSFDIIIEETPTRSKAIVYCPLTTEVYDKLEIQVAAEKASHLPCLNVEIKYQIPELNDSITPKAVTVVTPTEVNDESSEPIGRCVFAKSSPMQLSTTPVKDSIKAVVYESFAHSVRPNDLLKLVSDDKTKSVYCQIQKIIVHPLSGVGIQKKFSELSTVVILQPLTEKTDDYHGKPRPSNLSGFELKRLTRNEMIEILCIPKSGLPLGWIDYENIDEPFFFPLEPATSIFQSATIAGLQGKGKTSFLRLFIMALTSIGVQNGSR